MRLFVSAGEASGDAYGAELASRIRQGRPEITLEACGAARLRGAGAEMIADSSTWGAMGVVESLKVGPRVLAGMAKIKRALSTGAPGLFIPIDFGFINVRLARHAKQRGWKVLYFIPPGSWRKDRQGSQIPQVTDEVVCPFPWSQEILERMGAKAHFFGHPLVDFAKRAPEAPTREGVAFLPGSRLHEIKENMAVLAEALQGMEEEIPVTFGVASSVKEEDLMSQWKSLGGRRASATREVHRLLKSSRAAVVCSGTATLESVLCGCPLVVVYRLTPAMKIETTLFKPKFDFAALPNIILGEMAFPELLGDTATGEAVRKGLADLLADGPVRSGQEAAIRKVQALAGEAGCLDKTAGRALSLLGLA